MRDLAFLGMLLALWLASLGVARLCSHLLGTNVPRSGGPR